MEVPDKIILHQDRKRDNPPKGGFYGTRRSLEVSHVRHQRLTSALICKKTQNRRRILSKLLRSSSRPRFEIDRAKGVLLAMIVSSVWALSLPPSSDGRSCHPPPFDQGYSEI